MNIVHKTVPQYYYIGQPKENIMAYKIDKGIPLHGRSNKSSKFPFNQMKVGDSFFAPHPDAKKARQNALARNAGQYRKPPKHMPFQRHFVTRTVEGGVRIWRVK
jgi:hypothetical protein